MLVSSTNSRISAPACDQNTPSPHAISGRPADARSGPGVGAPASRGARARADDARRGSEGAGRTAGRRRVTHVHKFDVGLAQLPEEGNQMPAVDRETILHTILAHHARN